MKNFLEKLKNLFCYCGYSKEEYASVKRRAYRSNYALWRTLNLILTATFAILTIVSFFSQMPEHVPVFACMSVYFLVITLIFNKVLRPESITAQFLIYLSIILLLVAGLFSSVQRPSSMAVTFIVLLAVLPTVMIDKPYYMTIVNVCAVLVFLLVGASVKDRSVFRYDLYNSLLFGGCGIFINIFYNNLRVQEFILQRNEQKLLTEAKENSLKTAELNKSLQKVSESVLDILGDVIESRDSESGNHVYRVRCLVDILAHKVQERLPEYHLTDHDIQLIVSTSVLHDVGKIGISDTILLKPGRLTDEEFETMKKHCEIGVDVIGKMKNVWNDEYLKTAQDICLYHHEKWDGRGYPKHLKENEIPIAAQIVSIADIYDALTNDRVYKKAFSPETASDMILNGECGAFSESMLQCFMECREDFEALRSQNVSEITENRLLEIQQTTSSSGYVIGLHDENKTLEEKNKLQEELAIVNAISYKFSFLAYVSTDRNYMSVFKTDADFGQLMDSFPEVKETHLKFDKMIHAILLPNEVEDFIAHAQRDVLMRQISENGMGKVEFRAIINRKMHHMRLRVTCSPTDPNAVILAIYYVDEEYRLSNEATRLKEELDSARREMANLEKLADRLSVITCISDGYDFLATLDAHTMSLNIYHVAKWMNELIPNMDQIVTNADVRAEALKPVIHPDDYDYFCKASEHAVVTKELAAHGVYYVNYRARKNGETYFYQTHYAVDHNNPTRIVFGLRNISDRTWAENAQKNTQA